VAPLLALQADWAPDSGTSQANKGCCHSRPWGHTGTSFANSAPYSASEGSMGLSQDEDLAESLLCSLVGGSHTGPLNLH
jgi:hypothetical protein